MSLPSSPIPHPQAAYMPTKHAGRAHDEESGSHAVLHGDHSQSSPLQNPLSVNASSVMSLSSRISIFSGQQIVKLVISGHNTIIPLPWLQRIINPRGHFGDELPSVENRSHSVEAAPGLTEHRRPTATSDHPPRTTESSTVNKPIDCKKRAGRRIVRREASPPNPVVQRREEICDVLEPLFSNAPFVLVCEGKEQDAVISTIKLGDALNSISLWAKLSGVARQVTRRWKRLLGPVRLELVHLRIVGRHGCRPDAFRGQFQIVNIAERIEALQKLISNYKYDITEPSNPDESELCCYHDLRMDTVQHSSMIHEARGEDYTSPKLSSCGVQIHVDRLKELSKLKLASVWDMLLVYPKLAVGNDVLYDRWIYSSKDIIPPVETAVIRAVADIEFVGFRIVEWPYTSFSTPSVILLVGSTVVFGLLVIVSQAVYRDWGVAYTAGAFYVALAGVLTTWIAWTSTNT
ncbi:hypothetical protein CABS01_11507 [Colletotrichum abscissum]|uniref:Uncharacterized protein n=1 Tax=Colletotrichum abscissum TaxID=1671311 RepID=A0A9P9XF90_9PEZI|nr:uncharacterized protein CABS01_11507 [Colletotrichum abscissum]KAI3552242.1 hypothetical protein CABS02_07143 [Colletotrichum abscissum]KAK1494491.1 hypothetical protein CABS01_11507 [Colletotrichum abscissum]